MTEQQENWFEKLHEKRNNTATTLMNDFAVGKIWNSVVEKYSDQAHFIYELLQNADDTKATKSSFELTEKGLLFKHNGVKHFWVSNPATENKDQEKNQLGDINAITAVARSNKIDHTTIGKFGVGFKAVFQYTETPYIYDPNCCFKIERFIVPVKIEKDFKDRKAEETVFYFPFDKAEMPANKAYSDILEKLKKLVYPTLFLTNLQDVSWKTESESGTYLKDTKEKTEYENFICEKIELLQEVGLNTTNEKIILFTRFIENLPHPYSIGYFLEEGGKKLIPNPIPAFCFFPTKEVTNLNFILHAPFLLTDSREGIKKGQTNGWNEDLIIKTAKLAADSLLILKDLKLIDDDIIKIIPYKQPAAFFVSFYDTIKEKFKNEELLPTCYDTYIAKENAFWAQDNPVLNIFSDQQLAYLIGHENAKWVFKNFVRNQAGKDEELRNYIDDCTGNWYDMNDMLGFINGEFIENQTNEWLYKFYEYLSKNNSYWNEVKTSPIFLNQDGKAVSAFNEKNKLLLYLPDNDGDGYETLNVNLFKETNNILAEAEKLKGKQIQHFIEEKISPSRQFYEKFGIREHTVADEIEEAIVRFQKQQIKAELFFAKAFKYFKNECPQEEIDDFVGKIKNLTFVPYYSKNKNYGVNRGNSLFYPTEKLVKFYELYPDTLFVNIKELQKKYPQNDFKILVNFLKKLGVKDKEPELKDEVYDIILPQYEANGKPNNNTVEEGVTHLKTLLHYYNECPQNLVNDYIKKLKTIQFLLYKTAEDPEKKYWGKAEKLYYPSEDLLYYFETKPDTKFVDLEDYQEYIEEKDRQILFEFLLKLGVSELPRIITSTTQDWHNRTIIKENRLDDGIRIHNRRYEFSTRITDKILDGLEEIIMSIDSSKSLLLWKFIPKLSHHCFAMFEYAVSTYEVRRKEFPSNYIKKLKSTKWLLSTANEFVAPFEILINELAESYERNSELEDLLGFKSGITLEEEKEIFIKNLSYEEYLEFKNWKEKQDEKKHPQPEQPIFEGFDEGIEWLEKVKKEYVSKPKTEPIENNNSESTTTANQLELNFDEDEEFAKGIDNLKKQIEVKKQRTELVSKINGLKRYSYSWFETFLNLLNTYAEKQSTTQQKSISFQEIKLHKTDNKYFILRGASAYVSPEIEDASDIKLKLVFKNRENVPVIVESVSKKGQDLLVYCPNSLSQQLVLRFSEVVRIEINFTPVIDLIERLYKAFINRNYIDEWEDIKDTLPALQYIYGPPGTGKTTMLCSNINSILQANADAKFLILTPTNKAADVLCSKLLSINQNINAVRLGKATDPVLEKNHIYRDSLYENDYETINVVASTIHRLPYFDIGNWGLLFQLQWDYVIFDESSMAGLHYIVFSIMALYKSNSETEFIVAGDPKQIPPVIEVNDDELENFDFKDENIYRMMGLESFDPAEQKIRENIDTIKNLDNQYRSVPQIGQLFSELSYSKLLKHDRETNIKESKTLPEEFKKMISENVTFIDIPLNQDNSIYKVNKLIYSSYQAYCAILVAEIIKFFDQANNGENEWTIGLIAPYKAQAILLNKLITSYGISESVKVYSDTVHGFQGDECDIVFFVCNPNNYFYSGHPKCLLSKEYIYNVAISRAKDYLVILHPYTKINKNEFINKIALSYNKNSGKFQIKKATEIEKLLFKDEKFIENNAYTTGHDNVNVFGLSEMKYFIKANDSAIDIQLRDLKRTTITTTTITTATAPQKPEIFIQTEIPQVEGVKIVGKIDLSKFDKYKKK